MADHYAPPPTARMGVASAESRQVQSDRAQIYYEVYGDGPALFLVPGAFDTILHWSFNIPAFVQAGYKVLAMNLRGHFMSPCHDADSHFRYHAGDIRAVLDAEGIETAAIAASSFGGFGALRFALAHPHRAKALILSGSTAGVFSDLNYANTAKAVESFLPYFAQGAKLPARFDDTLKPHAFLYRQLSQLGTVDGFLACSFQAVMSMTDQSAWLMPGDLAAYATPTLLVGGDRDWLLPPRFQEETARLIPGAQISAFRDAGHVPFWEDPERYNREVLRFII